MSTPRERTRRVVKNLCTRFMDAAFEVATVLVPSVGKPASARMVPHVNIPIPAARSPIPSGPTVLAR